MEESLSWRRFVCFPWSNKLLFPPRKEEEPPNLPGASAVLGAAARFVLLLLRPSCHLLSNPSADAAQRGAALRARRRHGSVTCSSRLPTELQGYGAAQEAAVIRGINLSLLGGEVRRLGGGG